MGKSKRSKLLRKEAIRTNPVGIPSVRSCLRWEEEAASENGSKSGYVQNLIEQVESRSAEQRDSGLNALATAAENSEILRELLTTNILNTAANLLLDESIMVRHSAAGSLRNISCVSESVCEAMVCRDVMKPLVALLKQKYGNDWSPCKTGKPLPGGTFKMDSATEALIQCLHLLSNLCAASETALGTFNQEKLFQILPKTLDVAKFGLQTALAGARCMQTVTEENKDMIPNIPELVPLLLTILKESEDKGADFTYLQTLVAGTVCNLLGSGTTVTDGSSISLVLQTLGRVLDHDEVKQINEFSSEVPLQQEGMDTGKGTVVQRSEDLNSDQKNKLEESASKILRLLEAETLAMEILSNLVFVEDEDGGEYFEDSDEEPMEEDSSSEKLILPAADFTVEVSQGLRNEGLFAKVLSKSKGLPINVSEILENNSEYGKELLEKLEHLRSVALLCLQNLLQAFDLDTLGGIEQLKNIYTTLAKILPSISAVSSEKRSDAGLVDFLEAVTSGLRAVLQRAIDENCESMVEQFSLQDLEDLLSLYSMGKENVRMATNMVRLIGSFGVLVSRRKTISPESKALMLRIGEFLTSCLSFGNEKLELIRTAEALDTIFDVFAEDDFNDVLKELTLIEKLKTLAPHFKKQIRNQRRSLGESRGVVETARTNLSRFIEYKRGLGC